MYDCPAYLRASGVAPETGGMRDMTVRSSPLTIRPCASSDWTRLCEIHDAAKLDELCLSVGISAFLSLEETFQSEGLFDGSLSVAESDGVVRGFVAVSDEELTWLYIEPAFYRCGIGRALVRHAIAASAADMRVDLLSGNVLALKLYNSERFTVSRRVNGHLAGNERFTASGLMLKRVADCEATK